MRVSTVYFNRFMLFSFECLTFVATLVTVLGGIIGRTQKKMKMKVFTRAKIENASTAFHGWSLMVRWYLTWVLSSKSDNLRFIAALRQGILKKKNAKNRVQPGIELLGYCQPHDQVLPVEGSTNRDLSHIRLRVRPKRDWILVNDCRW